MAKEAPAERSSPSSPLAKRSYTVLTSNSARETRTAILTERPTKEAPKCRGDESYQCIGIGPDPWGVHATLDLEAYQHDHSHKGEVDLLNPETPLALEDGVAQNGDQASVRVDPLLVESLHAEALEILREDTGYCQAHLERLEKRSLLRDSWREALKKFTPDKVDKDGRVLSKYLQLVDVFDKLRIQPAIRMWSARKRQLNESRADQAKTSFWVKAYYVGYPMVMFGFAFIFQSFMLHLTTMTYVEWMARQHGYNMTAEGYEGDQLYDYVGNLAAEWWQGGNATHFDNDLVAEGKPDIAIFFIDASGMIPLMFFAASFVTALVKGRFSIGLWTKTFIIAACMATMQGLFDVVTIMPDSSGWHTCIARLGGEAGIKKFEHFYQGFMSNFFTGLLDMMWNEIFPSKRLRYCADMMISGHTYFAVLFSLSGYKQCHEAMPEREHSTFWWIRRFFYVICILCVMVEMCVVAMTRFHYTVDMLASVVLVFLLFDSVHVEQLASDMSQGFYWQDPLQFQPFYPPFRSLRSKIFCLSPYEWFLWCRRRQPNSIEQQVKEEHLKCCPASIWSPLRDDIEEPPTWKVEFQKWKPELEKSLIELYKAEGFTHTLFEKVGILYPMEYNPEARGSSREACAKGFAMRVISLASEDTAGATLIRKRLGQLTCTYVPIVPSFSPHLINLRQIEGKRPWTWTGSSVERKTDATRSGGNVPRDIE